MSIRFKLLAFFGLLATLGLAAFLGLWLYGVPQLGVEGIFSHEYKRSIVSVEALADKERDTFERWFEEAAAPEKRQSQSLMLTPTRPE